MSLFLDEKTKEEKFLKAREDREKGLSESLIELDRKGEWLHKLWFNYGWNECEKHVRESASIGFDDWFQREWKDYKGKIGTFRTTQENCYIAWENAAITCAIAKDKEIAEKDKRIKELDDIGFQLSATQCVHPEALTIREGQDGITCAKQGKIQSLESQLQHSKEWFSEAEERIKLLESQLKERDGRITNLIVDKHNLELDLNQRDEALARMEAQLNCRYEHPHFLLRDFLCNKCGFFRKGTNL